MNDDELIEFFDDDEINNKEDEDDSDLLDDDDDEEEDELNTIEDDWTVEELSEYLHDLADATAEAADMLDCVIEDYKESQNRVKSLIEENDSFKEKLSELYREIAVLRKNKENN